MVLGLLPAIRGGLGQLAKSGQHTRLLDGYCRPYARAFQEVRYFSYLRESLRSFTDDVGLLDRMEVFPAVRIHPWLYTLLLPLYYRRQLARCSILRVFQVTGAVPAVVVKRRFGVPFVATYGFRYPVLAASPATRWIHRAMERLTLATADAVLVTTPELAAHVAPRAGSGKVHLIPNGVDTERFHPVPRPPGAVKTVLYVGRLSAEKNLPTLVAAAAKLAGRIPLRLLFVGGGAMRAALTREAEDLNVPVDVLPFVDHRRLPAVVAGADAFVLPSFTEGHPKVLLEAMSSGVPCVASDVAGNRGIVTDGETGLLFDPHDPGALAAALERLFSTPDLARELAVRGRAAVVERFELSVLVAREIALLRDLAVTR